MHSHSHICFSSDWHLQFWPQIRSVHALWRHSFIIEVCEHCASHNMPLFTQKINRNFITAHHVISPESAAVFLFRFSNDFVLVASRGWVVVLKKFWACVGALCLPLDDKPCINWKISKESRSAFDSRERAMRVNKPIKIHLLSFSTTSVWVYKYTTNAFRLLSQEVRENIITKICFCYRYFVSSEFGTSSNPICDIRCSVMSQKCAANSAPALIWTPLRGVFGFKFRVNLALERLEFVIFRTKWNFIESFLT